MIFIHKGWWVVGVKTQNYFAIEKPFCLKKFPASRIFCVYCLLHLVVLKYGILSAYIWGNSKLKLWKESHTELERGLRKMHYKLKLSTSEIIMYLKHVSKRQTALYDIDIDIWGISSWNTQIGKSHEILLFLDKEIFSLWYMSKS